MYFSINNKHIMTGLNKKKSFEEHKVLSKMFSEFGFSLQMSPNMRHKKELENDLKIVSALEHLESQGRVGDLKIG